MKTSLIFLASSLCLTLSSFGAQLLFENDLGETSVQTRFNNYSGNVGGMGATDSGSSTDGSLIRAFHNIGYRMANPDGTPNETPYQASNSASISSLFSGGVLSVDGEVDSEKWGDGLDYPSNHSPLVTDTNVESIASLYWDFTVSGGDVTIDASLAANDRRDNFTQFLRLSGPGGSIFDLITDSTSDPYPELSAPITLTPGRYFLEARIGEINGDDDVENRFSIQLSGVDGITRNNVPDGGSSLALLAGGIISAYAGRRAITPLTPRH